jgi:polyisoprenoid-binding protein YceI
MVFEITILIMKIIPVKKWFRNGIFILLGTVLGLFTMSFSMGILEYEPNPHKSMVQFKIKNLGRDVFGTIGNLKGVVSFNPNNIKSAKIDASVDVSTVNTGISLRNKHLQAKEYFNAAEYPNIRIKSKTIQLVNSENNTAKMNGTIIIKGIEKPLNIKFTFVKLDSGYILSSNFTIKRKDFNVGSRKTKAMKDKVEVKLDIVVS